MPRTNLKGVIFSSGASKVCKLCHWEPWNGYIDDWTVQEQVRWRLNCHRWLYWWLDCFRMGTLVVELYWKHAPNTCRNFAELSRRGYYNGIKFHRIITDFMIQGGDPTGTGWKESFYFSLFSFCCCWFWSLLVCINTVLFLKICLKALLCTAFK